MRRWRRPTSSAGFPFEPNQLLRPTMNDDQITQRVMALAGLLQALQEVRHLAENGRVDQARLRQTMRGVTFVPSRMPSPKCSTL